MLATLIAVIVIIAGFIAFIAWGRTSTGQFTLGRLPDEHHSFRKRQRAARRRSAATRKAGNGRKRTPR